MRSEDYRSLSVVSTLILANTSGFRTTRAKRAIFLKRLRSIDSYAVKTSEKANVGLLWPDPLALCTLGAQEVTANGTYRLTHATTGKQPSPSIRSIAHAQFAEGLHFAKFWKQALLTKKYSVAFWIVGHSLHFVCALYIPGQATLNHPSSSYFTTFF